MTSLVVGCRNEHGVDEDRTYSIDIGNNSLSNIMKCYKCQYEWIPRTKNPKSCPRCKTRLDWNNKNHYIEDTLG